MKKTKVPIRIVQIQDIHGTKKISIRIDIAHYLNREINHDKELEILKKSYIDAINDAKKIFYIEINQGKKYQKLSSLSYWKLGKILQKFNDRIKNNYDIINYTEAASRDFGLTKNYLKDLIIFAQDFRKKDISDNIPMAIYRALIWKKNKLCELGLYQQEKQKLIKRGKTDQFIGRENYKKELNNLVSAHTKSLKEFV